MKLIEIYCGCRVQMYTAPQIRKVDPLQGRVQYKKIKWR